MLGRLLVALVLVLWLPASGAAQDDMSAIRGRRSTEAAPAPAPPEWRAQYDLGVQAFEANDLLAALAAFTRAYELGGPPALAVNRAVVLERLERRREAREAYQRYLTLVPDAPDRAAIEARIEALGAPTMASRLGSEPAPPVLTLIGEAGTTTEPIRYASDELPERPRPSPGPEWVVSWVFLGLTAATAAGAGIAYGVGSGQFDELRAYCASVGGCTEGEIAQDPSHTSATAANVLWVTTGILGAVTVASFVIEGLVSASPPRRTTIIGGLRLDVGPGSLALRGSF